MSERLNSTQVCRQGLNRGVGRPGVILSTLEACSGGWVYHTRIAQPCPRCGNQLTVLSEVPVR